MTVRVVICDDQDLVRDGLQAILSTAPGIEVVGEASDGDTVLVADGEYRACRRCGDCRVDPSGCSFDPAETIDAKD